MLGFRKFPAAVLLRFCLQPIPAKPRHIKAEAVGAGRHIGLSKLSPEFRGCPPADSTSAWPGWSTVSGLGAISKSHACHLTLGIRQRLLLAVAVIHDPDVLILAQSNSSLDPIARHVFWQLRLGFSRGQGLTMFVVAAAAGHRLHRPHCFSSPRWSVSEVSSISSSCESAVGMHHGRTHSS